jgi:DNA-binding IclR family transcriptional regulator
MRTVTVLTADVGRTIRQTRDLIPTARLVLLYLRHGSLGMPLDVAVIAEAVGCSLKSAYTALAVLEREHLVRLADVDGPARYVAT